MELIEAMRETGELASVKQSLLQAIRHSVKNSRNRNLTSLLSLSNDLKFIIRIMDGIMNTKFGILKDLKIRLDNMLDIRTETEMYESARKVHQMIQNLQKTDSIKSIDPEILNLLTEKSCSQPHRINFNSDFYKTLTEATRANEPEQSLSNKISISKSNLQDHETSNDHEDSSNMSIQEHISLKVQFLSSYLDNYIQASFFNLNIESLKAKANPRKRTQAKQGVQKGIQAKHTALRKVTIYIRLWPL